MPVLRHAQLHSGFRVPASSQLHWYASQLGHDFIPSNADHHPVPLQRSPWSRLAVATDVDLFHASHHVFVLVASNSPRIEAAVVVVRKGMKFWNQLVQFPLPRSCSGSQFVGTPEAYLEPAAKLCVLFRNEVATGTPANAIRLAESVNAI